MCNLSEGIYNKGYAVGYTAGYTAGLLAGRTARAKETAHRLNAEGMPVEQIARAVKYSVDEVRQWLAEL